MGYLFNMNNNNTNLAYIPWHNTQSITNGISALNRMYTSLPNDSVLKAFIDSNCAHLLQPLNGNTGIPANSIKLEVLQNLPDAVRLQPIFKRDLFAPYASKAGVYVFFTSTELAQCGSCIDFSNRMQSHYLDMKNGKFFFGIHSVELPLKLHLITYLYLLRIIA